MEDNIKEIEEFLDEFSYSADNSTLQKMKELCFVYNISAEDIVDEWVAYSASRKINGSPTIPMLIALEKEELMKRKSKQSKSKTVSTPIHNASTIDFISSTGATKIKGNQSNLNKSFSPSAMSPTCFTPSQKYDSRSGSGDVVFSFGEKENIKWKYADGYSCTIKPYDEKVMLCSSYHFMSEKLRDRASILNDMIQESAEILSKKLNIEDWINVQLPSVEAVSVIGRICADNSGKINSTSLYLEGSQEMSSGRTVLLDVSQLEKFSFFPGQIIAGTGINSLGKKLVLHKLYDDIYPPIASQAPELTNCSDSLGVVIASGPFATNDTCSYDPLWDLMKYVKVHNPHVLILIGPLVDIKNESIQSGEVNEIFSDVFDKLIAEIWKYIESLSTKVILIPSTRDAHHDCIYPTPPFTINNSFKKGDRFYLGSDPCILNIEGVIFAITSTDILFHLSKEEISHPQLPDRLGRLCNHILTQKSFYPLYPSNEELNVDFLHYELHASLPVMPHVLIVPSDLRSFIKNINGCCCVNPERLTKYSSGGTFARLNITSVNKNYEGSVIDLIRAQIIKI